jgi:hypothetical protein
MSGREDDDYEIGYGKPPKQTQFEKGKSGNPSGRPKGSKNSFLAVQRVLNRNVQITIEGKRKKVPLSEAVAMSMSQKALAGDHRAATSLLKLAASLPDFEAELQKLEEIELTAHQQMDIIEMIDFLEIAQGLDELGFVVRTEEGRPKLALSMLDTTINEAMAAMPEATAGNIRKYYLEGSTSQSAIEHDNAFSRMRTAQRKRRALKRLIKS